MCIVTRGHFITIKIFSGGSRAGTRAKARGRGELSPLSPFWRRPCRTVTSLAWSRTPVVFAQGVSRYGAIIRKTDLS